MKFLVYAVRTTVEEEGYYGYKTALNADLLGQTVGDRTYIAAFDSEHFADRYRHYLSNNMEPDAYLDEVKLLPWNWNTDSEPYFRSMTTKGE